MQVSEDSVNAINEHGAPNVELALFPQHAAQILAQQILHVGHVFTVFGPILPPQMQWTRTFSKVMHCFEFYVIPRPLQMPMFSYIKHPWSCGPSDEVLKFSLLPP